MIEWLFAIPAAYQAIALAAVASRLRKSDPTPTVIYRQQQVEWGGEKLTLTKNCRLVE